MLVREIRIGNKVYAIWEGRNPRHYEVTVQDLDKSSLLDVVLHTYSEKEAHRKFLELIGDL